VQHGDDGTVVFHRDAAVRPSSCAGNGPLAAAPARGARISLQRFSPKRSKNYFADAMRDLNVTRNLRSFMGSGPSQSPRPRGGLASRAQLTADWGLEKKRVHPEEAWPAWVRTVLRSAGATSKTQLQTIYHLRGFALPRTLSWNHPQGSVVTAGRLKASTHLSSQPHGLSRLRWQAGAFHLRGSI